MTEKNGDEAAFEDDENQDASEDFAALFESYLPGAETDFRVGDKVSGEIIAIGEENVFLNTGGKIDGVVEKAELLDEDGVFPHKEGDRLELYVVSTGEEELRLSKVISDRGNAALIHDAQKNRIPVSGTVKETCKGGFRVQVMGKIAFCPISQMDVKYVETPEEYVGTSLEFLIERVEESGRNIVVNRRKHLERQLAEARDEFLKTVKPGDIMDGTVVRLMPYGAFVELQPGVEGMVHISELSWSRIDEPSDIVSVGDTLPVKLLSIEKGAAKSGGVKIALSARQVSGDPWETVASRYSPGDKITGRVTRCMDFGAFVEVEPGIEGLVHISEISHVKRVMKVTDEVQSNQTVAMVVKSLDPDNRRMSLSMKDVEGDPWLSLEDQFSVGAHVTGTIEKKADFGYFVSLAPGITGLLPKSNIDRAPDPKAVDRLKAGDALAVAIDAIDAAAKKMTLSVADAIDADTLAQYKAGKQAADSPSDATAGSSGTGMSDLGQKLQDALQSKKT
ncbi:MAG: 30S ribosomal protein S1 [Thermodesulfobacteriota bacterium]|nr:30S ribosomal protein S1 [Thermodesulfobacteriota bacterium]